MMMMMMMIIIIIIIIIIRKIVIYIKGIGRRFRTVVIPNTYFAYVDKSSLSQGRKS
jgi:hypothetical protein